MWLLKAIRLKKSSDSSTSRSWKKEINTRTHNYLEDKWKAIKNRGLRAPIGFRNKKNEEEIFFSTENRPKEPNNKSYGYNNDINHFKKCTVWFAWLIVCYCLWRKRKRKRLRGPARLFLKIDLFTKLVAAQCIEWHIE